MDYSLIQRWAIAIRPKTLPAAVAPVILGTAIAIYEKQFEPVISLAALVIALLLQILSNLVNDLFDFLKGVDTEERLGPLRVTQKGIVSRNEMIAGISIIVLLSAMVGGFLALRGGYPILILGVFAIVSAFAYTAGPFPLGYYGFGDLFVFIFFGLVATMGTYYIQALQINLASMLVATGVGLLIVNILVVNNYRDYETDLQGGKKTLAIRLGKSRTRYQYVINGVIAYLVLLPLLFLGYSIWPVLLPFLSLPLFLRLVNNINTQTGRVLNISLGKSGQLALIYAVLFMLGVLINLVILRL